MALTRKFLKALGIEDEKIDEIINAHVETLQPIKDERDSLKEKAEQYDAVAKERDKLQKAADAAKDSGDDSYKVKFEELQKEFEAYKTEAATKAEKEAKARLYRELAKKAGVNEKRLDAIMKVTSLDGLKLDKDGKALVDADKLEESIKTEWADFLTNETERGAASSNPPAGNSGGVDLGKLSMSEYIAARKKK